MDPCICINCGHDFIFHTVIDLWCPTGGSTFLPMPDNDADQRQPTSGSTVPAIQPAPKPPEQL
jgi:hypothetical protein